MRYAVLADIHSNLEALEAVLDALEKDRVDQILCAGDLVGYGANPSQCLEIIRQKVTQSVCGNHEWACIGKMDMDWFNPLARAAALWTAEQLSDSERSYLSGLPLTWANEEVSLVHGSLDSPEQFKYIFNLQDARDSIGHQKTPICFVGHTHRPATFVREGVCVYYLNLPRLNVEPGLTYLVDVGSVGQPRDGDPRAAYVLYDTQEKSLEVRRVEYAVAIAQEKIRKVGLPAFFSERLAVGD